MAEIIMAQSAGFCFGVNRVIEIALKELENSKKIYTYGPLIHNKYVTAELEQKGIFSIENLDEVEESTIIIRSHGVGESIYKQLEKKQVKIVDGTCPFVKHIHNIVKESYTNEYHMIIIGNEHHPEVIGINGWCENTAIILDNIEQAENYDFDTTKHYAAVVQTTFQKEKFYDIISVLQKRGLKLETFDTICSATSKRQQEAVLLSQKVDKMIVIGDKNSSNTQKLVEICKKHCKKTYYIETICNLVLNIFDKNDKIGITAGASTPPAIIKEVIGTMSEALNNAVQNNGGNEDELTFEQMLDQTFVTLHTGDVVKGTVISISNEEVSVNLNYKSDGIIPRGEYSRDASVIPSKVLQPGDEIEVFVVRVNDGDGNVLLSRKRIEDQKGMEEVEAAYRNKTTITAKVTDVVKGGLIATVNGIRIFIPSSQVSNKFIDDLSVFKGKDLEFNIIELDKVKRRFIGGRKALIEKENLAKKAALFEKLETGSKVKGKVSRITDFGAFVDLGGVDGLIHISEMSWGRITNPKEILKEGQEVEVIILDVDKEKGKISLSLKDSSNNPWTLAVDKYPVGSIIEGKVVRMVPFGAFVELETGVDGLVHISQIANKHVVKPEDELKVGEIIKVKVLEVNVEQKKISLSKRQAEENASESKKEESEETKAE